jgi:hypothetical protein
MAKEGDSLWDTGRSLHSELRTQDDARLVPRFELRLALPRSLPISGIMPPGWRSV